MIYLRICYKTVRIAINPPGRRLSHLPGSPGKRHLVGITRCRRKCRYLAHRTQGHGADRFRQRCVLSPPWGQLLRRRQTEPRTNRRLCR